MRVQWQKGRWRPAPGQIAIRAQLGPARAGKLPSVRIDDAMVGVLFGERAGPRVLAAGGAVSVGGGWRPWCQCGGGAPHAVLLLGGDFEVEVTVSEIGLAAGGSVAVRLSVRVRIEHPVRFAEVVVAGGDGVTADELARRLESPTKAALAGWLGERTLESLVPLAAETALARELLERLREPFATSGLVPQQVVAVRLHGAVLDRLRAAETEIERIRCEREPAGRLHEARLREQTAIRREEAQVTGAEEAIDRTARLAAWVGEQRAQLAKDGVAHRAETERLRLAAERRRVALEHERTERRLSRQARQEDEVARREARLAEAATDLAVARTGVEALVAVETAKRAARAERERLDLALERERVATRGAASIPALLTTLEGPCADRLLRVWELELRRGLNPEQALAVLADRDPEWAKVLAELARTRRSSPAGERESR